MRKNIKNKNGYTIIETMIAIALFSIIVVMGMSALLNANVLYNKSKNMRSIMDSLSFTMDDISRNLRTGSNYYCIPNGGNPVIPDTPSPNTANCAGIEFIPSGGGGNPWAYEVITQNGQNVIEKFTYNGSSWTSVQMTPVEISMSSSLYPFSVYGASLPPDTQQPLVNIRLVGQITYNKVVSSFSLQTSISQRALDI